MDKRGPPPSSVHAATTGSIEVKKAGGTIGRQYVLFMFLLRRSPCEALVKPVSCRGTCRIGAMAGPGASPLRRAAGAARTGRDGGVEARRLVSRVLFPRRGDDHSSAMPVTGHLMRPTRIRRGNAPALRHGSLFGLAPGGVYPATAVTGGAVRSYRTLSPLPAGPKARTGGLLSVALSLGSPPPGVTRHRIPVEPGLSSPRQGAERSSSRLARDESGEDRGPGQAPGPVTPVRPGPVPLCRHALAR